MASISKRGKVWQAKVRRKNHPPYSATFSTKGEAEAWAADVEAQMGHGDVVPPRVVADRLMLADALIRYREEITPQKKSAKVEVYRIAAWLKHPFAQRALSNLRGADFADYRDRRLRQGAKPSTVRGELALISNLYTRCAREWGLEGLANPISAMALPKPSKGRERRLRPGEEGKLLEAAAQINPLLPNVIRFALETAMRRGEIVALQPHDIDLEARTVTLRDTKNGQPRTVPLSTRAIAALPPEGFGLTIDHISRGFRDACRLAGIKDLHFHDLRHEATSRLFELGKFNLIEISMITGHKDLHMLKRYTHLSARSLADRLG